MQAEAYYAGDADGVTSFDYPGALAEPSSFLQLLLFQEGGGKETEPELRRECRGRLVDGAIRSRS